MNSNQDKKEVDVVSKLMELAVSRKDALGRPATLSFNFSPNSLGSYGVEGSQWQAVLVETGMSIIDYGKTIEESGERLLNRLLHPQVHQDTAD
jgi:hypothetical protein